MKATVLAPVNLYDAPHAAGDVVDVDANTYRNLVEDGRLGPYVPSDEEREEVEAQAAEQARLEAEQQAAAAAAKAQAAEERKAAAAQRKAAAAAAKASAPK